MVYLPFSEDKRDLESALTHPGNGWLKGEIPQSKHSHDRMRRKV